MSHSSDNDIKPLTGGALFIGALCLAMANFLAILDTTIANVSVSVLRQFGYINPAKVPM